jgi:hypothetical protein
LTEKWDELEVRRLEVRILKAKNLPRMDTLMNGEPGLTDAYVVCLSVCLSIFMYICMCMYIYVCMYIYIYIYI